jgi:2-keto-4-pentenoate hydratase/2-oxohepta-3-ene-1,7-dioic acid hydratase in catechol pathway
MSESDRLWIARVARRNASGEISISTLRAATEGHSPGPETRVEEIEDPFLRARKADQDPLQIVREASPVVGGISGTWLEQLQTVQLQPPVEATKILGGGRNYRAHAEELGNAVPETPLLFFKPPSCLLPSGAPIQLPAGFDRIDMEAELVAVIGKRASRVDAAEAWAHVAGLTLGNDVSCRDLQKRDKQWTRAKGFDGFGPLGPWIRMQAQGEGLPAGELRILGYLDDAPIQDGRVADMVFPIGALIEHISACMTLEPGDLIYTGTPAGVHALARGNVARVEMAGLDLGRLTNTIA